MTWLHSVIYFQGPQEIAVMHCSCKNTSATLFFLIKLKFLGCSVTHHFPISSAANYFWTIPSKNSYKFIVFSRAPRNWGHALTLQEHKCNTFFIKPKFLVFSVTQHLDISRTANYFWSIPSMNSNKFIVFSRAPRNCGCALLLQEYKCIFFSY